MKVDRHVVHLGGEIGAVVKVERAQEVLLGLPFIRVLGDDQAGHVLEHGSGPEQRLAGEACGRMQPDRTKRDRIEFSFRMVRMPTWERAMTEETLRQLLARVHERLSSSSTIDPEARDMLATVMRDIDGALGRGSTGVAVSAGTAAPGTPAHGSSGPGSAAPGSSAQATSASTGSPPIPIVGKPTTPPLEILEALAVRFEAEHPAIAQLLRQIATLLGQAGI